MLDRLLTFSNAISKFLEYFNHVGTVCWKPLKFMDYILGTPKCYFISEYEGTNSRKDVGIDYCLKGNVHCLSLDNAKVEFCAR